MSRGISLIAGAACAFAAWWMLSQGVTGSWLDWPLDQQLLPLIVGCTILFGHLASRALRSWKIGHAAGFSIVAVLGLTLTILTSVVRQTELRETRTSTASAGNDQRKTADRMVSEAQASLKIAQSALTECASTNDRCIGGARQKIDEAERQLTKATKRRTDLGARVVTTTPGAAFGKVVTALGWAGDTAERWIDTLWAYGWSLFFEVGSIVALGYGLSYVPNVPAQRVAQPSAQRALPIAQPQETQVVRTLGNEIEQPLPNAAEQPLEIIDPLPLPNVDEQALLPALVAIADQGEIYTSQDRLADQLKLSSRKKVRSALLALEAQGHIQLDIDRTGTRIKIL